MQRQLFNTLEELKEFMRRHPERVMKKTPYRVAINGKLRYVFAGNSDQGIAAVAREVTEVRVESVGLNELALV